MTSLPPEHEKLIEEGLSAAIKANLKDDDPCPHFPQYILMARHCSDCMAAALMVTLRDLLSRVREADEREKGLLRQYVEEYERQLAGLCPRNHELSDDHDCDDAIRSELEALRRERDEALKYLDSGRVYDMRTGDERSTELAERARNVACALGAEASGHTEARNELRASLEREAKLREALYVRHDLCCTWPKPDNRCTTCFVLAQVDSLSVAGSGAAGATVKESLTVAPVSDEEG